MFYTLANKLNFCDNIGVVTTAKISNLGGDFFYWILCFHHINFGLQTSPSHSKIPVREPA